MKTLLRALALSCILAVPPVVSAQCELTSPILPDDRTLQAAGSALDAEGDWLLVGAPLKDRIGSDPDRGNAYAYRRAGTTWSFVEDLGASAGTGPKQFGASVDLHDRYAAVGAPFADFTIGTTGAVYMFGLQPSGSGFALHEELRDPSGISIGSRFGTDVAIAGDFAFVGAPGYPAFGPDSGAVYLFERMLSPQVDYVPIAILFASDAGPGDLFGESLDAKDGAVVIGAPGHAAGAGAAYVFEEQGGAWVEVAKLVASTPQPGARLGASVGISGRLGAVRLAMVGAPEASFAGVPHGAVYTYQGFIGMPWQGTESQKLGGAADDGELLGSSLALNADAKRAVFGAPGHASGAGRVWVYEPVGNPWLENGRLTPAGTGAGDAVGRAVALVGSALFAGAPGADTLAVDAGGVSIFGVGGILDDGPDCDGNGVVDLCDIDQGTLDFDGDLVPDECEIIGTRFCSPGVPNSSASPGVITVFGSPVVEADDLVLQASDLPTGPNIGYFVMGTGTNTFVPPGSVGRLCLAPGLIRFLPPPSDTTDQDGGFTRIVGTRGPDSSAITAGSTWGFQAWHRDGMNPSNFTDAVSVTFR